MKNSTLRVCACVLLVLLSAAAAPVSVTADETATSTETEEDEDDEDDGDTIINIDTDGIIDSINNLTGELTSFTGSWNDTLQKVLIGVLFHPFRTLAQALLEMVIDVLTYTPDVRPNPAVEEIHRLTLVVAYALAGLALMGTGLLYIMGPILGVSYQEARMTLPRVIVALVFATVAPVLLQYTVELSDVLVEAFKPDGVTMTQGEFIGVGAGLVIAWVVNSAVLLVVVLMFVLRAVYITFTAAISPLIALGWAFPTSRSYAEEFIAGYWTALMMAPLDVLALRFSMAMLEGQGASIQQYVGNWVIGLASFTLLIIIPYQLHGASKSAVRAGSSLSRGVEKRTLDHFSDNETRNPPDNDKSPRQKTRPINNRSQGDD